MQTFRYDDAPFPIRPDIPEAHRAFWVRLAGPGSWWTGAERVAIGAETRNALACRFCAARKQALSPYAFEGEHAHGEGLPPRAVDAVHRIVNDQARITRRWVEENAAQGLSKAAYVELVGVVVAVFSIDEFHRALGLALQPLPVPRAGAPDGHLPSVLSEDIGFVPTVPPHGAVGREAGLWPAGRSANVIRALTLVPQALRDWLQLASAQYLSVERMANFVKGRGALHQPYADGARGRARVGGQRVLLLNARTCHDAPCELANHEYRDRPARHRR